MTAIREYMHLDEEKELKRLLLLREEVAEQQLRCKPCPLFDAQLVELEVMTTKLLASIHRLQAIFEKREPK